MCIFLNWFARKYVVLYNIVLLIEGCNSSESHAETPCLLE
jgi:hypothetical protein